VDVEAESRQILLMKLGIRKVQYRILQYCVLKVRKQLARTQKVRTVQVEVRAVVWTIIEKRRGLIRVN